MTFLICAWYLGILLFLSQTSNAQDQASLNNGTVSWGGSPSIFSKRTTCSGTCESCYGTGSVLCGSDDACFNPTIGDACCAEYNYSCSDGYYCAPDGLDMQCCSNSLSSDDCINSINNGNGGGGGGGSGSGGLSTGAKAGIGIGVTVLILIIAGLAAIFCLRQRNRRRKINPAPVAWQMPELAGGQEGPAVSQSAYNGPPSGYNGPHGGYNGGQVGYDNSAANYNGAQGGYENTQSGYDAGYGNPDAKVQHYGGPPVAEVYTPGDGPKKAGYSGYVPSHVELAETPSGHAASPAINHNYPVGNDQDRIGAAEMYGSHPGQNY